MSLDNYIFKAHPGQSGSPLVFAFHGTGGDENQFFGLVRDLLPDAGIISPRGDVSEHGAARFFRRKAEGVYDMEDLAVRTNKMAAFIRAHKQQAAPSKVIGIGYSNGANILASVLMDDPDLFDQAILMHPLVPWTPRDISALSKLQILVTAGRNDPICPVPLTSGLADYFKRQGSDIALDWHEGGHELRNSEIEAVRCFLQRE